MGNQSTGLYNKILEHMKRRMLFVEDLAPGPLCSLGSVIANQKQANEPFHWVMGDDEDLGINICLVAPSGFAKSHTMKQFVHRQKGISPFKSTFRGKITEAGFVGTINKDGEPLYGDAFGYSEGILAFNEIANLFCAEEQDSSSELINQVMEALTERRISKRLAYGTIDYPTLVTIWGGIQPRRFDFSQGLGRRFLFICRSWTEEDMKAFKLLRRNREDVIKLDMDEVQDIRNELVQAMETFNASEIKWEKGLMKYIEDKCESHLQMQMLEKVLIGKETLNQYDVDTLVIHNNDENIALIDMVSRMQGMVAEGSDVSLLINVLQAHDDDYVSIGELWETFRAYNYTLPSFQELISTCSRLKVVNTKFQGSKQYLCLRDDLRQDSAKIKTAEEIIDILTDLNK